MSGASPSACPFDLAIVGGGIVGAGVARDAARRGLRVALFEREDFASGTSAGSTRLIHGGLRYLASADFALVRLDLRERETLLRIAPHLVRPLPFVLPFVRGHRLARLRFRAGMLLYDALSFDKTLPGHRVVSGAELSSIEPALDSTRFDGGALFYDAQVHSPERLTLENLIDARAHGAVAFTYTEVTGAIRDGGRVAGVRVRDRLTGDTRDVGARLVVNAAGPWFDAVDARLHDVHAPRVRTTKGVHIACEPFTSRAIVLESSIDRRVVFAIPWAGFTWVGTTDTDFCGDPSTARATKDDVRYLVESLAPSLPGVRQARRYWTSAAVRALATSGGAASDVSRMHRVVTDTPGLVSIVGGKITGYRAIAQEVADTVCERLGLSGQSSTSGEPLPGGGPERSGVPFLDAVYGSRAIAVATLAAQSPPLAAPLASRYPDIAAQVVFAIRHEWCRRLDDFMLRRSYLGFQPDRGVDAVDAVSCLMQRELDWSDRERQSEIDRYRAEIAHSSAPI